MNSLNSVLVEGHLARDPEKKEFESGSFMVTFTIATNRWFSQDNDKKSEVSYFDIEVWNSLAENCFKTLKKGSGLGVVGRLKQDRWHDKEGNSHSKVKIVAETVGFKTQFDRKISEVADLPEEV